MDTTDLYTWIAGSHVIALERSEATGSTQAAAIGRAKSSDRCIETVDISIGLVLLNDLIIKNPGRNDKKS